MVIRNLKAEDAPYMLEWMHDESVVRNMHTNFAFKTIMYNGGDPLEFHEYLVNVQKACNGKWSCLH